MSKIRVLVVDDSFFIRQVVSGLLNHEPDIEVVGKAKDGFEAVLMSKQLQPDVIALDFMMPKMDGLETLKNIMRDDPHAVIIMVSGISENETEKIFECLRSGAVDCIMKPSGPLSPDIRSVAKELVSKVRIAAQAKIQAPAQSAPEKLPKDLLVSRRRSITHGIVVIGSSTGGPAILEEVLPTIPADFSLPIVVAQHMPKRFTETLSNRLDKLCVLDVKEAETGDKIVPGKILVGPGDSDIRIMQRASKDYVQATVTKNEVATLTPSVDELFLSASEIYKENTIGIVMTGMGKDGLEGARKIKANGGIIIVQDEASSAVYGMGKEVVTEGLADDIVPAELLMMTMEKYVR